MAKQQTKNSRDNQTLPWYSGGLAFSCTQCGQCCSGEPGYVFISPDELELLAETMGTTVGKFEHQFVRDVGNSKSLKEYPDGDCILLDPKSRKCLAYKGRPIQCRTWPFWDSTLQTATTWAETCDVCPGAGVGTVYTFDQIETRRKEKSV